MTRSNLYITLSNGRKLNAVADSSSAPEQGYIVEQLFMPLLSFDDSEKELALLKEHCCMDELRTNATYRCTVDLKRKEVGFFEEKYNYKNGAFKKGKDLTDRYKTYINTLGANAKKDFKNYSNEALIAKVNSLPYFQWDDEAIELLRRWRDSNGAFDYEIRGNTMVILKNNEKD